MKRRRLIRVQCHGNLGHGIAADIEDHAANMMHRNRGQPDIHILELASGRYNDRGGKLAAGSAGIVCVGPAERLGGGRFRRRKKRRSRRSQRPRAAKYLYAIVFALLVRL